MASFLSDQVLVISYYTLDTPYEKEVENLQASCKAWGIDAHIEGVKNRGSWERNCAIKPFFILNKWMQFQRPLFFVDADAVFCKSPDFTSFFSYDFSVMHLKTEDKHFKIRASSLFVNATALARKLLEDWCTETKNVVEREKDATPFLDQSSLCEVLEKNTEAKIYNMPLSYCKVFDVDFETVAPGELVIQQFQASRRFKDFSKNVNTLNQG